MGKVNNDFSPASVLNGLQELAHEATLAADKKAFQVAANESAALFRTLGAADFIEYDWPTMAWRLFATLRLRGITVLYLLTDIGEPQLLVRSPSHAATPAFDASMRADPGSVSALRWLRP